MTFKEKYHKEKEWLNKVVVMEVYHLHKLCSNKKWKISDTAKYFGVSKGLVSENLNLAENLMKVESCSSRKKALEKLKER
jgi:hypothetical protein